MNKRISMIAAIGESRELGKDNKLLFDIPEDMKFFRETTRGKPVIMGRKTAEHLVEFYTKGPLPGRRNIVVTRNPEYTLEGFTVVSRIEDAITIAQEDDSDEVFTSPAKEEAKVFEPEIFIIGGGEIYKLGLPFADRLYLTIVNGTHDADAFFPEYTDFTKVISERKSSGNGFTYTFKTLERA